MVILLLKVASAKRVHWGQRFSFASERVLPELLLVRREGAANPYGWRLVRFLQKLRLSEKADPRAEVATAHRATNETYAADHHCSSGWLRNRNHINEDAEADSKPVLLPVVCSIGKDIPSDRWIMRPAAMMGVGHV